jgi:hypothetical protein
MEPGPEDNKQEVRMRAALGGEGIGVENAEMQTMQGKPCYSKMKQSRRKGSCSSNYHMCVSPS